MRSNQTDAPLPLRLLSWSLCILLALLAFGAAAGGDWLSALLVIAGAGMAAPPIQQMLPLRRGVCLALAVGLLAAGLMCSRSLPAQGDSSPNEAAALPEAQDVPREENAVEADPVQDQNIPPEDAAETSEPETPSEPVRLTPGEYTVGTHVPAGRYRITSEEDWCIVTTDHIYTILDKSDDSYTCNLQEGEELTCSESILLTPTE